MSVGRFEVSSLAIFDWDISVQRGGRLGWGNYTVTLESLNLYEGKRQWLVRLNISKQSKEKCEIELR